MRRNKAFKTLTAVLMILAILFGCTIIRSEPAHIEKFDTTRYDSNTHYSEVLRDMGPPTKMSQLGTGMVWLYEDVTLKENQIGFGPINGPLSIFKLNFAAGDGKYQGTVLTFDLDGRLTSTGTMNEELNLGEGMAFQFAFVVSSLVDIGDIRQTPNQHTWGKSLLQDVPAGLNSQQNLDTGAHGVELMTTPQFTGQQSLANP
ncbi:hypothetical protein SYK_15180 [Pseudodesulfovibrio nedwellii]|uniref:Lipoprotein n=1 Tax=Pseudodesulfovibrio nedwellii TaxID=2973072 RepID=A0ABM8B055_9BACT|nr:hypothetical protein [Pseudodesulfovibrio nedwellii]BDQ37158.1 hypothetical protein SYK_15180 [Pseudodesulfovibrio nedwellii]